MTTQMEPDDFRERLDDALRAGDVPAPGVAVDADIALGRRMLRRRRAAVVVGAGAVVAALTAGSGVVGSTPDRVDQGPRLSAAPSSADELLAACKDGNRSARATRAMFGAGDPTIKVESRNAHQVVLALEAKDERHWAWCWVDLDGAELPSAMEVYDATRTTLNSMYSSEALCTDESTCHRFTTTVVDRRPAEVAAVEFLMADGERTTVESVDGYIVLNYVGEVPEGSATTPEGLPVDFAPVQRITFLDSAGRPIAAQAQDGSGEGPDGEEVDGLPSIREFPALRGGQSVR